MPPLVLVLPATLVQALALPMALLSNPGEVHAQSPRHCPPALWPTLGLLCCCWALLLLLLLLAQGLQAMMSQVPLAVLPQRVMLHAAQSGALPLLLVQARPQVRAKRAAATARAVPASEVLQQACLIAAAAAVAAVPALAAAALLRLTSPAMHLLAMQMGLAAGALQPAAGAERLAALLPLQ